jgi:hypothetical protein
MFPSVYHAYPSLSFQIMKLLLTLSILLHLSLCSPLKTRKHKSITPQKDDAANRILVHKARRSPAKADAIPTAEWTPDYDSSGISPWSDAGRSELLDYQTDWDYCPRYYLNCHTCPRDPRCRLNQSRPDGVPSDTVIGGAAALAGTQLDDYQVTADLEVGEKMGSTS